MSNWSVPGAHSLVESSGTNGSTLPTQLAATASAHTYGAWVQLIAATGSRYQSIDVWVGEISAAGVSYELRIAKGAAASEVTIIDNIHVRTSNTDTIGAVMRVPINIERGVRLSASLKTGSGNADTVRIFLVGYSGGFNAPANANRVAALNTVVYSRGVSINAGASANTFGSWTQLTAASPFRVNGFVPIMAENLGTGLSRMHVQVAKGASASEQIIWEGYQVKDSYRYFHQFYPPAYIPIEAGVRLAARAKCDTTGSEARVTFCTLLGF